MSDNHGSRPQEAVPTESPVVAGSMLEKMAAAMDAAIPDDGFYDLKDVARAALQAIREPDDAMLRAGISEAWTDAIPVRATYCAMIDAILNGEA